MLSRGEIYFAGVDELNDASECRPRFIFKGAADLWQRLSDYILQEACFSSDYFQRDKFADLQKIFELSNPLGNALKKAARNRDVGLEEIRGLFGDLLRKKIPCEIPAGSGDAAVRLVDRFISEQLPQVLRERSFIASFSKNGVNPTMWGHYANADRGFAIIYESFENTVSVSSPLPILWGSKKIEESEFGETIGMFKDALLELREVRYGQRLPKANAFHRLIPRFSYSEEEEHYDVPSIIFGDAPSKKENLVGVVKHADWRYEKEVRLFFPYIREGFTVTPEMRCLRVSGKNIVGIIFGPRMSHENKVRAIRCAYIYREFRNQCGETVLPIGFYQANDQVDRYNFSVDPVGVLASINEYSPSLPILLISKMESEASQRMFTVAEEISKSGT